MSDKKNVTLGKRATGRSSSYEKSKKEYKENAWGKVTGKLELVEND